jgi:hypothetical protein
LCATATVPSLHHCHGRRELRQPAGYEAETEPELADARPETIPITILICDDDAADRKLTQQAPTSSLTESAMDGPLRGGGSGRPGADLADTIDLRSVISSALSATPILDDHLRRGVWTYVCAERTAGTPPTDVIVALTELVGAAKIADPRARRPSLRKVVTWCVEAYFGHLGGTGVPGRDAAEPAAEPAASGAGG